MHLVWYSNIIFDL